MPLFYALLLANGNFLAPKTFTLDAKGKGNPQRAAKGALTKLAAVAVGLAVAGRRAPIETVVGLLAYAAYVTTRYGPTLSRMRSKL